MKNLFEIVVVSAYLLGALSGMIMFITGLLIVVGA